MLEDPTFEGRRLAEPGDVALVFAGRACGFTSAFLEEFRPWEPPAGVRKAIRWLEGAKDPLWDRFDVPATPTLVLFRDGTEVWRLAARHHEYLPDDALARLEEARRDARGAGRGAGASA